jgi:hypothetical protein
MEPQEQVERNKGNVESKKFYRRGINQPRLCASVLCRESSKIFTTTLVQEDLCGGIPVSGVLANFVQSIDYFTLPWLLD